MRRLWCLGVFCSGFCVGHATGEAEVRVNSEKVVNRIDGKLYGLLLEHLYHSVSNGVWGENVWNRSFEELHAHGKREVNDKGEVTLDALGQPLADFRIFRGRDYELTLEVKRLEGEGCVLVGVRDQNRERMLTNRLYCYLGAEDNTVHELELSTGWVWHTPVVTTRISDVVSGSLVTGQWVKVRVRCDGERMEAYVDGKKIFDRMVENCPRDGAITLGGKDCRVAFRRIRVSSLDGKSQMPCDLGPARHWALVGSGSVEAVYEDVLNQDVALCLHASRGQVGLEQPENYCIRRNDALVGSVFLKGTVGNACVQLLEGGRVLCEQKISGIGSAWKEFPLELSSSQDVARATLRIQTTGPGDLYLDQVSLMHRSSKENQGFRPELTRAVADLKPALLRWPGGSFSEHYHFEHGLGRQSERKGIYRWDDFDPLSFGTDEFIAFCRKVGAEPQIVVPIGYHNYAGYSPDKDGVEDWLQRALDWLEYCNGDAATTRWGKVRAANGHPEPYGVKYWEIDNEVWKMSPKTYVEIARIFSIAMKKKDPTIRIIGCGCGGLGTAGVGLDSILIHDVGRHFDYISPHHYQSVDKYGNDGVEEYGRYLEQLAAWIEESENPGMKIYLSEWNLDKVDMRTGLFAGGLLNRMETIPAMGMAAPALLLRHTSAPGWNNAFINFDQNGWFPAPNYVVFQLWRRHFLPNRVELTGDTRGLNVVATRSEDGRQVCLKIVNPSGHSVVLRVLDGVGMGRTVWEVVSASSLMQSNTMDHPDRIRVQTRDVSREGDDWVLTVPPYSASVLTMRV